jgi:hypothetical protein
MDTLENLLDNLEGYFPGAEVYGHNELDILKACPSFDVQEWLEANNIEGGHCHEQE